MKWLQSIQWKLFPSYSMRKAKERQPGIVTAALTLEMLRDQLTELFRTLHGSNADPIDIVERNGIVVFTTYDEHGRAASKSVFYLESNNRRLGVYLDTGGTCKQVEKSTTSLLVAGLKRFPAEAREGEWPPIICVEA